MKQIAKPVDDQIYSEVFNRLYRNRFDRVWIELVNDNAGSRMWIEEGVRKCLTQSR